LVIDQLIDQLGAEPFDVHRAAGREVSDRFLALGGAKESANAASDRLALASFDIRSAHWAASGQRDDAGIWRASFHDHLDNFRDHVACAPHDHGVTDTHILAV
jgi:hypothetical protein